MSPAQASLEKWLVDSEAVEAACFFGSGVSDLDYMIFLREKGEFYPALVWEKGIWRMDRDAGLAIVGESYFDLAFCREPLKPEKKTKLWDMLRNSNPPPRWIKDEAMIQSEWEGWIEHNTRKQLSDEQIRSIALSVFLNTKWIFKKYQSGSLHGRHLIARGIEPHLFALAREVELRKGGTGFHKAKNAEKVWSSAELEQLTINYSLDEKEQFEALVKVRSQLLYWLKELKIMPQSFLCQPWQ